MLAHQQAYLDNKTTLAAHNYCAKHCLDLSSAGASDAEGSCLSSCVKQYASSMSMLMSQQENFQAMLKDIKLNGGDIYAARDI